MLKNFLFDAILFMQELYTDKKNQSMGVCEKIQCLEIGPNAHAIIGLTSSYEAAMDLTKIFSHGVSCNRSDFKDLRA